jgi:hypothetical protein
LPATFSRSVGAILARTFLGKHCAQPRANRVASDLAPRFSQELALVAAGAFFLRTRDPILLVR